MAAIDFFGRTIRVTAAGSTPAAYANLHIESFSVWCMDTTASLVVHEVSTGGEIYRHQGGSHLPQTQSTHFTGTFGQLSFTTVTACTAYIQLR